MSIRLAKSRWGRVADAMTEAVGVIDEGTTAADARRTLTELSVTGAPVVRNEEVIGVVSLSDLATPDANTPVTELMSREVYAVRPDDALEVAAQLMVERRIHRVVVVDHNNQLAGIVSAMDALERALAPGAIPLAYADD